MAGNRTLCNCAMLRVAGQSHGQYRQVLHHCFLKQLNFQRDRGVAEQDHAFLAAPRRLLSYPLLTPFGVGLVRKCISTISNVPKYPDFVNDLPNFVNYTVCGILYDIYMPQKQLQTIVSAMAGIAFAVFTFSCCNVPGAHATTALPGALDKRAHTQHAAAAHDTDACCHIQLGSALATLHNPDISISAGRAMALPFVMAAAAIALMPVSFWYTLHILRLLLYELLVRTRQGSSKLFNQLIELFRIGLLNPKTF